MSRREIWALTPLLWIFLFHGFLYYLFPQQHYLESGSESGWISYIKYACVLFALPVALTLHRGDNRDWLTVGFAIFLLNSVSLIYWSEEGNPLLLQYLLPTTGYFFAPYLSRLFSDVHRLRRYCIALLVMSAAAVIFEYYTGGYFQSFSRSGLRSTGPFINPNNTGIVAALVASVTHYQTKGRAGNVIAFFCCVPIIILTGSKTAAVVYAIGLIMSQGWMSRVAMIPLLTIIISLYAGGILDFSVHNDLRGLSLESARIRAQDYALLLNMAYSVPLLDLVFGFLSESLVDNAYIDLFAFGGLYTLIIFVVIQGWVTISSRSYEMKGVQLILFLMFLAMLSTNVPRLWPIAYAYWAMVGTVALRKFGSANFVGNLTVRTTRSPVYV